MSISLIHQETSDIKELFLEQKDHKIYITKEQYDFYNSIDNYPDIVLKTINGDIRYQYKFKKIGDVVKIINMDGIEQGVIKDENESYIIIQSNKEKENKTFEECIEDYIFKNDENMPMFKNLFEQLQISSGKPKQSKKFKKYSRCTTFRHGLIFAPPQTLKSRCIINLSILLKLHGFSSLILLRDCTADLCGLKIKFDGQINTLEKCFLEKSTAKIDHLENHIEIIISEPTDEQFMKLKNGGKDATIFICIANVRNIKKWFSNKMCINSHNTWNFAFFIDEVDLVNTKNKNKTESELAVVKKNCALSFGVSATLLDELIYDYSIRKGDIYILYAPINYKGFDTFLWKNLDGTDLDNTSPDLDVTASNKIDDDILKNDPYMKEYIREFSAKNKIFVPYYEETGNCYHPNISLINMGGIKPMENLAKWIQTTYGSEITVITYNGQSKNNQGGLRLYSNFFSSVIKIKTKKSVYKNNIHQFDKLAIQDLLKFLLNNGGVEKFSRIIIISGVNAGRSISFTSGDCNLKDEMNWHLTEMRYICANDKDLPEIIQEVARGCVVRRSNINFTVYTNRIIERKVIQYYRMHEEIMKRNFNVLNHNNDPELSSKSYMENYFNIDKRKMSFINSDEKTKKLFKKSTMTKVGTYMPKAVYEEKINIPGDELFQEWKEFADERKNITSASIPEGWKIIGVPSREDKKYSNIYDAIIDFMKDKINKEVNRNDIRKACEHDIDDRRELTNLQVKYTRENPNSNLTLLYKKRGNKRNDPYTYMLVQQ